MVTDASPGAEGVILPSAPQNRFILILNDTLVAISVYPPVGGSIFGGGINLPFNLPSGDMADFSLLDPLGNTQPPGLGTGVGPLYAVNGPSPGQGGGGPGSLSTQDSTVSFTPGPNSSVTALSFDSVFFTSGPDSSVPSQTDLTISLEVRADTTFNLLPGVQLSAQRWIFDQNLFNCGADSVGPPNQADITLLKTPIRFPQWIVIPVDFSDITIVGGAGNPITKILPAGSNIQAVKYNCNTTWTAASGVAFHLGFDSTASGNQQDGFAGGTLSTTGSDLTSVSLPSNPAYYCPDESGWTFVVRVFVTGAVLPTAGNSNVWILVGSDPSSGP
jgi:hypothetical protein